MTRLVIKNPKYLNDQLNHIVNNQGAGVRNWHEYTTFQYKPNSLKCLLMNKKNVEVNVNCKNILLGDLIVQYNHILDVSQNDINNLKQFRDLSGRKAIIAKWMDNYQLNDNSNQQQSTKKLMMALVEIVDNENITIEKYEWSWKKIVGIIILLAILAAILIPILL